MEHLSSGVLLRLLGANETCGLEPSAVVGHVGGCSRCWRLASSVLSQLESRGELPPVANELTRHLLALLRAQRERAFALLGAQGRLAKLKRLKLAKRLELIRTTAVYRTPEMFEVLLRETEALARSGSEEAEDFGRSVLFAVDLMPKGQEPLKSDLRAQAWIEIANGRRVRADFWGALQALRLAKDFLASGAGNPLLKARLHKILCSVAFDTEQHALGAREAARAQAIYRDLEDWQGVATSLHMEANSLVEIDPERGLRLAEEGLRVADEFDIRLQMYLKTVALQCLVELGRTGEALRQLDDCRRYYTQFQDEKWLEFRIRSIEARLLEALGRMQEAELLYRDACDLALEGGFAKDSFTMRLILFDFYLRRNRMTDAKSLCIEAIETLEEVESHEQMRVLWQDLVGLIGTHHMSEELINTLRLYIAHHWRMPAKKSPFSEGWAELTADVPAIEVVAEPQPEPAFGPASKPFVAGLPPEQPELVEGGLRETVDDFERRLIASALEQSGGRIRETARVLRTSRNTLKAKMKRYGLRGVE